MAEAIISTLMLKIIFLVVCLFTTIGLIVSWYVYKSQEEDKVKVLEDQKAGSCPSLESGKTEQIGSAAIGIGCLTVLVLFWVLFSSMEPKYSATQKLAFVLSYLCMFALFATIILSGVHAIMYKADEADMKPIKNKETDKLECNLPANSERTKIGQAVLGMGISATVLICICLYYLYSTNALNKDNATELTITASKRRKGSDSIQR